MIESSPRRVARAVIASYRDPAFLLQPEGFRVFAANAPAQHWCALSEGELENASLLQWLPALEANGVGVRAAMEQIGIHDAFHFEETWRHPEGRGQQVELVASALPGTKRPVGLLLVHDLAAKRRAEDERLRFETRLQRGRELEDLGVLASGTAHDFNNLLTGILGNAELALAAAREAPDAVTRLEVVLLAARRASELARQLMDFTDGEEMRREPVALAPLVEETTRLMLGTLSRDVELRIENASTAPIVEADATSLRRVVINLVMNAAEAIGDEVGKIRVSTGVRTFAKTYLAETFVMSELTAGDYAYLEVEDDGCGMDPATLERAFDPYFSSKYGGRGLGLANVLRVVQASGGAVKAVSERGRGSTLRILLPAAEASAPAPTPAAETPAFDDHGGNVLVVEDEILVANLARTALQDAGFEVRTTKSGAAAWEILREERRHFTAVVLDVFLPDLDGLVLLERLRRIEPSLPVLLTSGSADQRIEAACDRDPACCSLRKPFGPSALVGSLRRALERANAAE